MNTTSRQQHIKDIITGCGVPTKFGDKCGYRAVGRTYGREWRVDLPVCERHAEAMVANGFKVKLYKAKGTGQ